jgi:phosphatidylinositol alpha-1,6-mannosyltransferase
MSKVLIVTNDFPPRSGGIQSFVRALAARLPADGVVVYAPAWEGAAEFDARQRSCCRCRRSARGPVRC